MKSRLDSAAKLHGITREQMAAAAGITERALRNKIAGRTQFTIAEAFAIRDLFPVRYELEALFSSAK